MAAQTQAQAQIDRREVIAIIRALAKVRKFVVRYGEIREELSAMIEDDEEYYKVEDMLYEHISEGRIKHAYKIYDDVDGSDGDVIVVAPKELSAQQLATLEELARLYEFAKYDGSDDRAEIDAVIHNLVKMWFSSCTRVSSPAEAIYALAREYGLRVEEDDRLDSFSYRGNIYYSVEGLGVRLAKCVDYCNYCADFPNPSWSFIEKCYTWHFEGEEEGT